MKSVSKLIFDLFLGTWINIAGATNPSGNTTTGMVVPSITD